MLAVWTCTRRPLWLFTFVVSHSCCHLIEFLISRFSLTFLHSFLWSQHSVFDCSHFSFELIVFLLVRALLLDLRIVISVTNLGILLLVIGILLDLVILPGNHLIDWLRCLHLLLRLLVCLLRLRSILLRLLVCFRYFAPNIIWPKCGFPLQSIICLARKSALLFVNIPL